MTTNRRDSAEPVTVRVDPEAHRAWERICNRLRMTKRQSLEMLLLKVDSLQEMGEFPSTVGELFASPPRAKV